MSDIQRQDRPDQLSVLSEVVDGVLVVTVHGEIDYTVSSILSEALLTEDGATPPRIVTDLSGVTFMDSSGINVFLLAHQRVSSAQGWLRIAAAQKSVLRVLTMVGVDRLIDCHASVEQALKA
ncbi:STAS domain-containing protein [Streptomyces sp. NPDC048253]|uniref:STAS domain-containing protein n=1 Tax=Streptomyces sp. NPDC048253 TaxID=3365524 RepID=UPI0037222685